MKSETLKLVESMNNLNESRYYYREIEEVKTNLSEIIKLVNTANNTLIDVSNNDDNDYDENQKDTLANISEQLTNVENTINNINETLSSTFKNRIRPATQEEKDYINNYLKNNK